MIRKYLLLLLLFIPTSSGLQLNAIPQTDTLYSYDISNYGVQFSTSSKAELVSIGDGKLSEIWEDVPAIIVPSLGDIGKVKSVHDRSSIYLFVEEDYTNMWTALQFDTDHTADPENYAGDIDQMELGDDMWIFGEFTEVNFNGDGYAVGQEPPFTIKDEVQDIFWETVIINDTEGNPLNRVYEIRRSLLTRDSEGADVQFQGALEQNTSIIFATDQNHKTETSLSIAKLVIGGNGLSGGNVFTPEPPEIIELLDAPLYFFTQVSIGFFFGSLTIFVITVPSVYIMQRNIRRRR